MLDDGDEILLLIVTIVDDVGVGGGVGVGMGQIVALVEQFVFIFLAQIVTLVQQNNPGSNSK